ncbi:ubiquinol-cytochrome c reductase [Exilibacterium tricleocarpae]|uniref:Cytochrome b n=1 Tax=Exilibacterium tricleocarpae TaxID=2591008 RepID=A0A545TSJ4_9GAMM|nr:cytochrome b N-terminal domain-containing protein [Exilibacterium tricleocarpae]TQV80190.1 ubiquinol-cytochrome c reductase [Exilibacterium tricleocarpae]
MTRWLTDLWQWVDARLPVQRAWDTHMGKYYAPKNFNFWYFFGVLSLLVLVNQLLTGIWLAMSYVPSAEEAFASVEYIMRDVEYGWLLRYMHSTGASAFFVVVYLHMFRGLLYGSYKAPRELVWIFGMTIYLVLMAEAFLGYVLPWGQMSYWGAQVIVSLFGAIPVVGEDLVQWIRGDYLISGITLNRFFSLHVVALPIVLLALVVLHLLALHEVGSNNPDGVEIKKNKDENGIPKDGVPFHPFYTVHDLVGITVFLFVFCIILFFMPEMGGFFLEYANFEEANNLKTPEHIAPVWYFTPFYAILRAVTFDIGPLNSKFLGFMAMAAAIAILFVLPWLDKSPVRSMRYKGNFSRIALLVFAAAFVILGYLGVKAPTPGRTVLAQVCTLLYFAYFIGMPFWTRWEKTQPVPDRVQMKGLGAGPVLGALALFAVMVVVPIKAVGAESAKACGSIDCDEMVPDLRDKESLQRGAKYFINYCMGCHAAEYSRYERVADDLEIPHELMMDNLVFTDQRIGSLMTISMDEQEAKGWFGAAPPDLTLVARSRSPEWLYTYLRNFYRDDTRPLGVNNKVFDNVGMPHVMLELQGLPECAPGPLMAAGGRVERDELGDPLMDEECGKLVVGDVKGSMEADEFDQAIYDLVNFLEYLAEPIALERQRIGIYVLLFLSVLFVFTYLLNREYWREIH